MGFPPDPPECSRGEERGLGSGGKPGPRARTPPEAPPGPRAPPFRFRLLLSPAEPQGRRKRSRREAGPYCNQTRRAEGRLAGSGRRSGSRRRRTSRGGFARRPPVRIPSPGRSKAGRGGSRSSTDKSLPQALGGSGAGMAAPEASEALGRELRELQEAVRGLGQAAVGEGVAKVRDGPGGHPGRDGPPRPLPPPPASPAPPGAVPERAAGRSGADGGGPGSCGRAWRR